MLPAADPSRLAVKNGEHLRMTGNLLRGLPKKFFAIPYPRPRNLAYPAPVLSNEGALSRSDLEVGQSENWPDRGAPDRSTDWWPRWSAGRCRALRHWARAVALPREVGTL